MSRFTEPSQELSGAVSGSSPAGDPDERAPFFPPSAYASPPRPSRPSRPSGPSGGRLKWIALGFAGWVVVSVVVLCSLLLARGPRSAPPHSAAAGSAPAAPASAAGSPAIVPDGWISKAADEQTNCAAHAYGKVATFFATTPCKSVRRLLMLTNQGGRDVVVAAYTISLGTSADAARFNTLVTADGTGNIDDLLREGVRFDGGPSQLPTAAFASRQQGTAVRVAEAGYVRGTSKSTDPKLSAVANQAVAPA